MLKDNLYKKTYITLRNDVLGELILPSYKESIIYKRASGYFSINSLIAAIDGIIPFILNGGQIKLICSPNLTENDVKFIELGNSCSKELALKRLEEVVDRFIEEQNDFLKLDILCNLIACEKLVIKIAYVENGLYHDKFGIFTDSVGEKLYFNGSMNATANGLFNNSEVIVTMRSWCGDAEEIEQQEKYFDTLWNLNDSLVKVFDFPTALKAKLFEKYRKSDNYELAIESYLKNKTTKIVKHELTKYQNDAIDSFMINNGKQFYEMATGTGKTFTTVKTIERLHKDVQKIYVVICVPQTELLYQWEKELKQIDIIDPIILGGRNQGNDAKTLFYDSLITYEQEDDMLVCIGTYDKIFADCYDWLKRIENLFFIVDEAHNLSTNQIKKLPNAKYRLGLSATLERHNANETQEIIEYFTLTDTLPYKYTIDEAIENGYLVQYEYNILEVVMNETDFEKYANKTKAIFFEMNNEHPDDKKIKELKMQRSRIVKQCDDKIDKLVELVNSDNYNFKNSVIYCGQGKTDDDDLIINKVTQALANKRKYDVHQYTSKINDRDKILTYFEMGYYDCLIAIKCFDEGVDVPKLDKIYLMASDASKKQTVQRRGRVLRNCRQNDKKLAYIYDMVMVPPKSEGLGVKNLVRNELIRIKEYSRLAINKDTLIKEITSLEKKYDINDDSIMEEYDNE